MIIGQSDGRHVAEVRLVPRQLIVQPFGRDPTVGRQDLVLLIDVDDLVNGDVVADLQGSGTVRDGPHARVVIGHQVLGQRPFVFACPNGGKHCKTPRYDMMYEMMKRIRLFLFPDRESTARE